MVVALRAVAIVLAAGKSSRMGRNKLLLEVDGATVLDRLLAFLTSVLGEVIVVTGNDPEPIRAVAESRGARVVHNPNYEEGMTTSFQAGLRAASADAVFLVLGDQIGLEPGLLRRMIDVMERDQSALIVSPAYGGRRGHPTLFRRPLFSEIFGIRGEETLKDVVLGHESEHRTVEGDEWTVIDLDTPEDYEQALRRWKSSRASP
jgi:molybdenum cofactor cytidylyltransferase